ncbi:hypothetical protein RU639_006103 [Aspergillus parasiticus]
MNFTITAAPISIGSFLALTIGLGGPPFFFYGFLFIGLGQLVLCLAAAEIASSMPHPLGQAYWVVRLGPQKYNRLAGYILGWLTNGAWLLIYTTTVLYTSEILMAVIEVSIPQYSSHSKPWHHFLFFCGVFINGAALFVLITLLVRANPKQSATAFSNVLPGLASLGACDAATHMAEELELPIRDVPRVMIGSALLNYLVASPTMIIFLFCIVNPEAMLSPVGGQPLIQLLADGYASKVLTAIAGALIVLGFAIGSWAALISWSRLYWSFSRTNGFPFSYFTEKTTDGVPVNALILGTVLTIAIGAIQLGSSTALNAVLGGASLCSGFSWIVVFSFLGSSVVWICNSLEYVDDCLGVISALSSCDPVLCELVGVVVISFVYYILFYRHRSDEME